MSIRSVFLFLLAVAAVCALPAANAAVLCANTAAAIAAALNTARNNGENDEIRIVAGSHLLGAPLVFSTHEAFALTMSGRWNASCDTQNGASSVLDGGDAFQILYVFADVDSALVITDLHFTRGNGAAASIDGAALSVETSGRLVRIERNLFINNRDAGSAGAVRIAVSTSSSSVTVRNNIVFANNAPEGAGMVVNASVGVAYITGNTIIANQASAIGALCGGLCVMGGSDFIVANNILWNNPGGDLLVNNTASARLLFNDIGTLSGTPIGTIQIGNLNVDPGFAPGLLNLQLAADSPLVNAGSFRVLGGIGDLDVAREPRLQGVSVDIGAYETDVLFRNGFQ